MIEGLFAGHDDVQRETLWSLLEALLAVTPLAATYILDQARLLLLFQELGGSYLER